MTCEQTEKISLLIDGELSATEAREIERHLVGCGQCQHARADFLKLRSQIADYSPLPLTSTLQPTRSRILSGSDSRIQSEARPAQSRLRDRLFAAFVPSLNSPVTALTALALIAVTVGVFAWFRYSGPDQIANNEAGEQKEVATGAKDPTATSNIGLIGEVAGSSGQKSVKGQRRESNTNPKKPNSRIKPTRERSAPPASVPQPRNLAPPTYAGVDEGGAPANVAVASAVDTETLTRQHLEQSELLLRAFRNVRPPKKGAGVELSYERKRARQLVYRNILLRREADSTGDVQVATLLNSLEPILLDIANLRDQPPENELLAIRERVERKSLVALLQINSSALARVHQ
jgi:negative regulator of sigma E activity